MLSLFLFFISFHTVHAQEKCQFQTNIKVVSLSAPITYLLQRLDLIHSPQLQAVSDFHHIEQEHKNLKRVPGGEFISQQLVKQWEGHIVWYDQSNRLSQIFARNPKVKSIEISTRELNWEQSFNNVTKALSPYLNAQCETELVQLHTKMSQDLDHLKKSRIKPLSAIFFVGECIENQPLPKMVMLQDGVLKDLLSTGTVQSFNSPLAYLMWSEKDLADFKRSHNPMFICLNAKPKMELKQLAKNHIWNFSHPHILNPGFPQLEAFIGLFAQLKINNL
jgi:hypothetical protein